MMSKRPRINITGKEIIIDKEAYLENSCSKNAKQIILNTHQFRSDIWTDKHYNIRVHQGDHNGIREGIALDIVLELINNTFNHVINYSLKYGKIVNFPPFAPPNSTRIVLQNHISDDEHFLNVAVEYHFLDVDTYEITIWTAMKEKHFNIREGQFIIQLHHDKTMLYQFVQKKLKPLISFERK